MSAFVVDRHHIRYLSTFARHYRVHEPTKTRTDDGWQCETYTPDEAATLLFNQCVRSVAYRYPDCKDGELPGKIGETYAMPMDTIWRPLPWDSDEFTPGRVLAACDCLEYQSCETPDYHDTPAYQYLSHIRHAAIRLVPGYQDTWEIKSA